MRLVLAQCWQRRDTAPGKIRPAADQSLQLPVGIEERDIPLPDLQWLTGQFQYPVIHSRLAPLQHLQVVVMHLPGQGSWQQIGVDQAAPEHVLDADAQAGFV